MGDSQEKNKILVIGENILVSILGVLTCCYEFFMACDFLRNIVWLFLNLVTICVAGLGLLYCWSNASEKDASYWWILIGVFVASIIMFEIAKRLGVVRVCPHCGENRAIRKTETATGRHCNGELRKTQNGWQREIQEEYQTISECIYDCGYRETETSWKSRWENV